jgi:hypothetical protein
MHVFLKILYSLLLKDFLPVLLGFPVIWSWLLLLKEKIITFTVARVTNSNALKEQTDGKNVNM